MAKKMLFKLVSCKTLPSKPWQCPRWTLFGETIEGHQVSMNTAKFGKGELRWIPKNIKGETLRVTYHQTRTGALVADLWRPSWAEGEDLAALFAKERTLYLVNQEKQFLVAEVAQQDRPPTEPTPRMRL